MAKRLFSAGQGNAKNASDASHESRIIMPSFDWQIFDLKRELLIAHGQSSTTVLLEVDLNGKSMISGVNLLEALRKSIF